jgi:enoyl-CoA hydratase
MPADVPALTFPSAHVAELRLRRPDSANRLEPVDLEVMLAHLAAIEARPEIHALVFAADGKVFSAGFDLNALTTAAKPAGAHLANQRHGGERLFERVGEALAHARPVVIAAIDGAVVGGSTDFALACDLRIGTPRTKLQMPAANIGVPLYAGALHRYVSRFGIDVAKRLVFMAETLTADDLLRIGFLSELVAEGEALPRAHALAAHIAALPAAPIAAMKRALNAVAAGVGIASETRADLDAAYDPAVIAARVAAMRQARSAR